MDFLLYCCTNLLRHGFYVFFSSPLLLVIRCNLENDIKLLHVNQEQVKLQKFIKASPAKSHV